jgi:hypothetical protein
LKDAQLGWVVQPEYDKEEEDEKKNAVEAAEEKKGAPLPTVVNITDTTKLETIVAPSQTSKIPSSSNVSPKTKSLSYTPQAALQTEESPYQVLFMNLYDVIVSFLFFFCFGLASFHDVLMGSTPSAAFVYRGRFV